MSATTRTTERIESTVETVEIEEVQCPICEQWYEDDDALVAVAVGATYEPDGAVVTAATAIESATSPVRTARTLLPAPTDLQATGTTATSLSVAWTRHHTTGQTRVECKPTDAAQWGAAAPGGAETTVAFDATQATLSGLRNAERYDVRVVAVTEDAETVDTDPATEVVAGTYGGERYGSYQLGGHP